MNESHIGMTGKEVELGGIPSLDEFAEFTQTAEMGFLEYYGLNEQPFGVTPDPRFLYLGSKHRQALAALTYGMESNRGFLTLIAKPGMGKTTLLFQFLESLRNKARTVFLFQTDGDSADLMRNLLADLDLDSKGKDLSEMRQILNQYLIRNMQAGQSIILVIDEAQNLDEKVLESIRLLSNFETPWMKLMQIVLAGQPQLGDRLAKPSMAQLRQRVSFAIRIEPFSRDEVSLYIDHRLGVAGYRGTSLFTPGARILVAERSEGTPRNINNICFCAMSLAWATKQKSIGREMVTEILSEMDLESSSATTTQAPDGMEQTKYGFSQNLPPAVFTVKEPRARGWAQRADFASALLFVLRWLGFPYHVGNRLGISTQEKPVPIKSLPDPPPAMSMDPIEHEIPDTSPSGHVSDSSVGGKNPTPSHGSGAQSTPSNTELK